MIELMLFSVFLIILGIGGFIADYIFPHIGPLQRYIDSLPMLDDYEEADEETDILWEEKAS